MNDSRSERGGVLRSMLLVVALLLLALVFLYVSYVRIPDPNGNYAQSPLLPGTPASVLTPSAVLAPTRGGAAVPRASGSVLGAPLHGSHTRATIHSGAYPILRQTFRASSSPWLLG